MVTLQLRQINVPPGHRVLLHDVNWEEFEKILAELGENRASRIAYSQGTLEIRMPLPEHEINKEIIGDMVKILLEELDIDRECFGSTTFKRKSMLQGIEPDNCFYIQNSALMIGKKTHRFNKRRSATRFSNRSRSNFPNSTGRLRIFGSTGTLALRK